MHSTMCSPDESDSAARRSAPPLATQDREPAESTLLIRQRAVRADWLEVREFLNRLPAALAPASYAVCVLSDKGIRRYNKRFRGREEATDVLSFPAGTGRGNGNGYLGDILISAETARANARRYGLRLEDEIKTLAVHGLLHLLGYDHERDNGEMARRERRWAARLGLPQSLLVRGRGRHRRSGTAAAPRGR